MAINTLAPLYTVFAVIGLWWGSGLNRGQSSVEWGDFPSFRLSISLSAHLSVHPFIQGLAGWQAGLAGWRRGLAGWLGGLAAWL